MGDDGQITINYNTGSPDQIAQKVKWINNMAVDSGNGDVTISWNDNTTTSFERLFKWINGMSLADNGNITLTWNDGSTSSPGSMKWIKNISINSNGNQKVKITWNDNTEQEIGEPINYILQMAVNANNHLIVRYSDPLKRGNVSYDGYTDWTDLGLISQQYEYGAGSAAYNLSWTGIGSLIDDGIEAKTIACTINPTAFINSAVDTVTLISGVLKGQIMVEVEVPGEQGEEGTTKWEKQDIELTLNSSNTTVTKQLTGLQFEITTNIESSGAATTDFINLSITGIGLSFSTSS